MGQFQKRLVAQDIKIDEGQFEAASAHVAALSGMRIDPTQFVRPDDMPPVRAAAQIQGTVMAGHVLSKEAPVYPAASRQRGIERDGHIHTLNLVSTPDADLAISALAAVQKWVYAPYLLNGEPTEVDTTISVNYKIGH
jgi:protein TonB